MTLINFIAVGKKIGAVVTKLSSTLVATSVVLITEDMRIPLFSLLAFMLLDLVTGVTKSYKKVPKEEQGFSTLWNMVSSKGLRKTFTKSAEYMLVITMFFILEMFTFGGPIDFTIPWLNYETYLTDFVIVILTIIELKSIDENMKEITGNSIGNHLEKATGFVKDLLSKSKVD